MDKITVMDIIYCQGAQCHTDIWVMFFLGVGLLFTMALALILLIGIGYSVKNVIETWLDSRIDEKIELCKVEHSSVRSRAPKR